MKFKKDSTILNIFSIFFIGYSALSIWLLFVTKEFNTEYGSISLIIHLIQIVSLILILLKKSIGAYVFTSLIILNAIFTVIMNSNIKDIITTIFYSGCLIVVFYFLYKEKM